jgi:hypothetical protein
MGASSLLTTVDFLTYTLEEYPPAQAGIEFVSIVSDGS